MQDASSGHEARAHTADVILEAWGPDLVSCCEEAVAALVGTYADARAAEVVARHHVHLEPGPDDELLVQLLEEVIFVLDTSSAVPVAAEVRTSAAGGIDAVILLADPDSIEGTGSVPKAVSRSELSVAVEPGRVRCRVLVDV